MNLRTLGNQASVFNFRGRSLQTDEVFAAVLEAVITTVDLFHRIHPEIGLLERFQNRMETADREDHADMLVNMLGMFSAFCVLKFGMCQIDVGAALSSRATDLWTFLIIWSFG